MAKAGEPGQAGYYFGTEIQGCWWRRYGKDGLLARGSGLYWFDATAFSFRRHLTSTPIVIPMQAVYGYGLGRWHAGRWGAGRPVLKILWQHRGRQLSSGFLVARERQEVERIMARRMTLAQPGRGHAAGRGQD